MGADGVVLAQPQIDGGLSFSKGMEPLCIEHFTAQRAIKPLIVSVLPWCAGDDM